MQIEVASGAVGDSLLDVAIERGVVMNSCRAFADPHVTEARLIIKARFEGDPQGLLALLQPGASPADDDLQKALEPE